MNLKALEEMEPEVIKSINGNNEIRIAARPTDSEIIEMLRLKVLENPSFTTLVIPKGLLLTVPKKIQGMEVIESDLADADKIYFSNTEAWK